jgi:outer membrane protein TolC
LKLAKVTQAINTTTPRELARALMQQEKDVAIARARLQAMRKLIGEAERYLSEE